MDVLDIIGRHAEEISSKAYRSLEEDLLNTQYELTSHILVRAIQKLTQINPDTRIDVILSLVENYLHKSTDREQAYRILASEVREAMKNPELSSAEKIVLASLD